MNSFAKNFHQMLFVTQLFAGITSIEVDTKSKMFNKHKVSNVGETQNCQLFRSLPVTKSKEHKGVLLSSETA